MGISLYIGPLNSFLIFSQENKGTLVGFLLNIENSTNKQKIIEESNLGY